MIYTDTISQQKLADTLGISRVEVRRLTEKGIFILDEHKKLSLSQAKDAYEVYHRNVEAENLSKLKKSAKKALEGIDPVDPISADFAEVYERWIANVDDDPLSVLNAARAYLTAIQTKQEKIKLDALERKLIPVEEVNADAEQVGNLIRTKLTTLPSRVSTMCEGRTARDIEEILSDEINNALEELHKLFIKQIC